MVSLKTEKNDLALIERQFPKQNLLPTPASGCYASGVTTKTWATMNSEKFNLTAEVCNQLLSRLGAVVQERRLASIILLTSQKRLFESSVGRLFNIRPIRLILLHQISICSALYRTTFEISPSMTTSRFTMGLVNSSLPNHGFLQKLLIKNCRGIKIYSRHK